jgi:hypothetical protein
MKTKTMTAVLAENPTAVFYTRKEVNKYLNDEFGVDPVFSSDFIGECFGRVLDDCTKYFKLD